LFLRLATKKIKHFSGDRRMCFMLDESADQQFFMVGGLLFVKIVKGWNFEIIKIAKSNFEFGQSPGRSPTARNTAESTGSTCPTVLPLSTTLRTRTLTSSKKFYIFINPRNPGQ